ncbi:hypothetical protein ABVT39_002280 [Epinephelus coioides]
MGRHWPLQIEIGDCRQSTEPVSGQSRTPTKTTSPLPPFLPPSSPSRLMLLYLQPSPRIRGVETTSRHFVCADRPSETGGDNREKERLRQPTVATPGTTGRKKEWRNPVGVTEREKHLRKDKTSVEGKPSR